MALILLLNYLGKKCLLIYILMLIILTPISRSNNSQSLLWAQVKSPSCNLLSDKEGQNDIYVLGFSWRTNVMIYIMYLLYRKYSANVSLLPLLLPRQILPHQCIICYVGTRKTDGIFQVILEWQMRPYRWGQWGKGPYIQGEKLDRSPWGQVSWSNTLWSNRHPPTASSEKRFPPWNAWEERARQLHRPMTTIKSQWSV